MKTNRSTWQYVAAIVWMVFTVALASWWLIFGLSQARHLAALEGPDGAQIGRVTRMLVLEGVILVGMLMAGGAALLVAIRREQRRRRELRAFFMAFTHDVKTSLTSLRLQAEALQADLPAVADNPNLRRMLKDSVRLQVQLENALALATTDGGILLEPIDIPALVDYLRDDFPELQIEVTGMGRVRADRRAFESVLRNVLQNAVVHGGATRVMLEIQRRSSGIEIVIRDDGAGASGDLSMALERPFVRPSTTSGSGVGLYVCGRLMSQMHGRIQVVAGQPGFSLSIQLPEAI